MSCPTIQRAPLKTTAGLEPTGAGPLTDCVTAGQILPMLASAWSRICSTLEYAGAVVVWMLETEVKVIAPAAPRTADTSLPPPLKRYVVESVWACQAPEV